MSDRKTTEPAPDTELTPEELDAAVGGALRVKDGTASAERTLGDQSLGSRKPLQAKEQAKKAVGR